MHRLVLFLLPAVVGCGSSWSVRDEDGDGKAILEGDCYDAPDGGGDRGPEASEVWYDGIDQNCDGASDFDKDGDGFESLAHGGTDCWDDPDILPDEFEAINGFPALTAAQVHPDAIETFYDAVDANCDGASDFDADGDGFDSANLDHGDRDGIFGDDCYDSVELDEYPASGTLVSDFPPEEINSAATETWYDGTDQNCDGQHDYDKDGDTYPIYEECNDEDPLIFRNPEIDEIWYNDEDENCDGNLYDKDLDGHLHVDFGGDDCWDDYDTIPSGFDVIPGFVQPDADQVFPEAIDAPYDGVDGDCAGDSDFDADDDGFNDADHPDRGGNYGADCDDGEPDTYPGADDTWYDGADSDCAGNSDYDADYDGFDSRDISTGTDCDDTNEEANPGQNEDCNTDFDDNCDGGLLDLLNADNCETFYLDADDDGYGSTTTQCWCEPQVATDYDATRNDDCNDAVAAVNPGATEICDSANTDEDCDGTADNNDSSAADAGKTRFYHDDDDDGYGDLAHAGSRYCDDPSTGSQPWSTDNTDCDDASAGDHPGATEIVGNQDDENCDGSETCYDDDDNDGYLDTTGDTRTSSDTDCVDANEGTNTDPTTDCNDSSATAYPGASETVADGIDQDCDSVDSCYQDSDNDNYGTTTVVDGSSLNCTTGTGAPNDDDCNDSSSSAYPGASETVADGIDQDCDSVDSCYNDSDGDNYGTSVVVDGSSLNCTTGTGAPNDDDCDDSSSSIKPGGTETVADGVDQDCDGVDSCYTDTDGDNFGTTVVIDGSSLNCTTGTGAPNDDDCNDASASIYLGASETVADGVDQDCDGVDSCYQDADGDNYGTSTIVDGSTLSCNTGTGSANDDDCDDSTATIKPGGTETVADGIDQDCDGVDSCYTDADGDNYGTTVVIDGSSLSCVSGTGAANDDDCNDGSSAINPAATEIAGDSVDQNCDTDEICYVDNDDDGYRLATTLASSDTDCNDSGEGASSDPATDCDDTNADRNPGEAEVCNDIDDDCDSSVDEGLTLYYADADADGYGAGAGDCATDGAANDDDCDDADEYVYPGATELCDGQQNDCGDSGWSESDEDGLITYETVAGAMSNVASAASYTLANGTYYVCAGTYNARLTAPDGVTASVIGFHGAGTTTFDNPTTGSTVSITSAASKSYITLDGLTITGGAGTTGGSETYGGGVLANASSRPTLAPTVTLIDCVVEGNTGSRGAGVAAYTSAWVVLDGTSVENNTGSGEGGGAYVSDGALLELTTASSVSGNTAVEGAGIYVAGTGELALEDSFVDSNTATGDGGGIWLDDGAAVCTNSGVYGNDAGTAHGGGVFIYDQGTFTATSCDFAGDADNTPSDVEIQLTGSTWETYSSYGATATFVCSGVTGLCTP